MSLFSWFLYLVSFEIIGRAFSHGNCDIVGLVSMCKFLYFDMTILPIYVSLQLRLPFPTFAFLVFLFYHHKSRI